MRGLLPVAVCVAALLTSACGDEEASAPVDAEPAQVTTNAAVPEVATTEADEAPDELLAAQTERLETAGWSVEEFQGADVDSGLLADRIARRGNRELHIFQYASGADARAFKDEFDATEHTPGTVRSTLKGDVFYWMGMADDSNVPPGAFEAAVATAEGQ